MKKNHRHTLFASICFILLSGTILFGCGQASTQTSLKQKKFDRFLNSCFREYAAENTVTLHFKLSNPSAYGIKTPVSPTYGDFSSDTLKTVVDGKEVLVATKANAAKKIKGGLGNFQYQIIKDEEGSDEYVIRLTDKYQYVRVINNMLTLDANKKNAARFLIESQATPTANEGIATSEVKVLAGNGNVTIAGAAGKKVVVSNILGQIVATQVLTSDNAVIAAPQGVVVVAVEGEEAVKAIVK